MRAVTWNDLTAKTVIFIFCTLYFEQQNLSLYLFPPLKNNAVIVRFLDGFNYFSLTAFPINSFYASVTALVTDHPLDMPAPFDELC
jgi:hypothetical protein